MTPFHASIFEESFRDVTSLLFICGFFLNFRPGMPISANSPKRIDAFLLFCLSLTVLAGCQSVGKQYVSPKEFEAAATVVGSSPFFIVTTEACAVSMRSSQVAALY